MKKMIILFLMLASLIHLSQAQLGAPLSFNITGEKTNLQHYSIINGEKIVIPYISSSSSPQNFGYVYDKDSIVQSLLAQGKLFDNKIYYELETDKDYNVNKANPYVLERPLAETQLIKNQLNSLEERQVKRFIDFSQIFSKENNLYDIQTKEVNQSICTQTDSFDTESCLKYEIIKVNVTEKIPRSYSSTFTKAASGWIIEFFNLFDLDPSFIDDTDSNWNSGTFAGMTTQGTGVAANLTSMGKNVSGHYASQVFDSSNTNSNWTNISVFVEVPYGTEIGRAYNDNPKVSVKDQNDFGFINTSGLVGLWHFNNESNFGENATGGNGDIVSDFSPDVNSERSSSVRNNGTTANGATVNKTNYILGNGAGQFDKEGDHVKVSSSAPLNFDNKPLTWSAWVYLALPSDADVPFIIHKAGSSNYATQGMAFRIVDAAGGGFNPVIRWNWVTTSSWLLADSVTGIVPIGQWFHVTAAWNGVNAGTNIKIYLNGQEVSYASRTAGTGTFTTTNGLPLAIGGRGDGTNGIDGLLDEVSVWNRTLSAQEIKNLYKRGAMRLNLSVRSCDDSACSGEAYAQVLNQSFMGGKVTLNNTPRNRYFQYNFTYSRNDTLGVNKGIIVNNLTIEFENASDSISNVTPFITTRVLFNDTLDSSENWSLNGCTLGSGRLVCTNSQIAIFSHKLVNSSESRSNWSVTVELQINNAGGAEILHIMAENSSTLSQNYASFRGSGTIPTNVHATAADDGQSPNVAYPIYDLTAFKYLRVKFRFLTNNSLEMYVNGTLNSTLRSNFTANATFFSMGYGGQSYSMELDSFLVENETTLSIPDITPPSISSLVNSTTTNESVIVTWTTNESANEANTLGVCPSFTGVFSNSNSSFSLSHSQSIGPLVNSTIYCFNTTACDSTGYCSSGNISFITRQNPIPFATESEARVSIGEGTQNALLSGYTNYTDQLIYGRSLTNLQAFGSFDMVAEKGNKTWAFNYVTLGEINVGLFNVTPSLYVLEMANKTAPEIRLTTETFINLTR